MFPNLQAEQARKKMTNQQIANYLGLSRTAFEQKKKSGRFVIKESYALCKLFKCNFEYLFKADNDEQAS